MIAATENLFLEKEDYDKFLRTLKTPRTPEPPKLRFPYNALLVCKHWNAIASTSRRLWSVVHLQNHRHYKHEQPNWRRTLQTHFKLSGTLDLSLIIVIKPHDIAPSFKSVNLSNVKKQRIRRIQIILDLLSCTDLKRGLHEVLLWLARSHLTVWEELQLTSLYDEEETMNSVCNTNLTTSFFTLLGSQAPFKKLSISRLPSLPSTSSSSSHFSVQQFLFRPTNIFLSEVTLEAVSPSVVRILFTVAMPALEKLYIQCYPSEHLHKVGQFWVRDYRAELNYHLLEDAMAVLDETESFSSGSVPFRTNFPSLKRLVLFHVREPSDLSIIMLHSPAIEHLAIHHPWSYGSLSRWLREFAKQRDKPQPRPYNVTAISKEWSSETAQGLSARIVDTPWLRNLQLERVPVGTSQEQREVFDDTVNKLHDAGIIVDCLSREELEFSAVCRRMSLEGSTTSYGV